MAITSGFGSIGTYFSEWEFVEFTAAAGALSGDAVSDAWSSLTIVSLEPCATTSTCDNRCFIGGFYSVWDRREEEEGDLSSHCDMRGYDFRIDDVLDRLKLALRFRPPIEFALATAILHGSLLSWISFRWSVSAFSFSAMRVGTSLKNVSLRSESLTGSISFNWYF